MMKKIPGILCIGLSVSIATFLVVPRFGLLPAQAQTAPASGAAVPKDVCLGCHGPYDKLAGAPANYVASSEEKINPHAYVPHTSKEAKAIPECTNCHKPHGASPKPEEIVALPKPDVQWCYVTCHHQNTFERCKNCH
jgi:mono/diheme cytochrome c family protein